MRFLPHVIFVLVLTVPPALASATEAAPPTSSADGSAPSVRTDEQTDFFERRIRPVLAQNCFNCHSASTNSRGGLRVDDRQGLITGGQSGPAIVPGDPDASLLIAGIEHATEDLKMPPGKKLEDAAIADLRQWVADGAYWPPVALPEGLGELDDEGERLRREHWAWQPLKPVPPPSVRHESWVKNDIDRFILAKLEEQGLSPAPDASRADLARRLNFDLVGLPPTPEEIEAFVADPSDESFAAHVDRLLDSPGFGERWGRHWLDIARFGESTGPSRNIPFPHAHRYRDYVIDAFRRDVPFDQFVQEQIAGDLLDSNSEEERQRRLVATGFLALGVKDVNQRFKVRFIMDNVDEQIDIVGKAFLGLTVSCARCHDHKFDPITANDYYALAGIFTSTELCAGVRSKMGGSGLDYYDPSMLLLLKQNVDLPPVDPAKVEELTKAVAEARNEFVSLRGKPEGNELTPEGVPKRAAARQKWNRLQGELLALTDPASRGAVAFGVRDGQSPADTQLRIRGEAEKLGPVVPRGVLQLWESKPFTIAEGESGRRELADWLVDSENPLTPRVIVNRVWAHLFGQGLVRTVDNFGVNGDTPSHPELLDHLAEEFVRDGWSIHRLIRRIVQSRTYQLAASELPGPVAVDPANRWLWRHAPRRLDAEEIRDAMLAVSGQLDPSPEPGSIASTFPMIEIGNNGPEAKKITIYAFESKRRSVYLPLLRDLVPGSLTVFDFPDQGLVTGQRDETTVSPQALYLLNDPFVLSLSQAFAERLLARSDLDDTGRVRLAYRIALGREATEDEVTQTNKFLEEVRQASEAERAAAQPIVAAVESAIVPVAASVAVADLTPVTPSHPDPPSAAGTEPTGSPELIQAITKLAEAAARLDAAAARLEKSAERLEGRLAQSDPLAPAPAAETQAAANVQQNPPASKAEKQPGNGNRKKQQEKQAEKSRYVPPTDPRTVAWLSFCQALFATPEFRYLR